MAPNLGHFHCFLLGLQFNSIERNIVFVERGNKVLFSVFKAQEESWMGSELWMDLHLTKS